MDNSKKKNKFIELLKIIFKRTRITTILLLLVTFASSTFAWFIYATKVAGGITAHIEAWNILFTNEDNALEEYVNFYIPSLYPGMPDYNDSITAYNLGEKSAEISYEIVSARILSTNYNIEGGSYTSGAIEVILGNSFPFKTTFSLANTVINPEVGNTTFSVHVTWPYESNNDALDTYWGNQSYLFSQNNPDTPSIEIVVKVSAIQTNENTP
jgi:hypothetical protein